MVAYVDDVAIIIVAKTIDDVQHLGANIWMVETQRAESGG